MRISLLIFFCFTALAVFSQNTYIAHRGASYLAPENTLAAVNLAWELGVDAVEVDVHLTADDRVVVCHDDDLKRTSGGTARDKISKSKLSDLKKIDVGSFKGGQYKGETIPLIDEVLETIPDGKTLVIEIKCGEEILPALKKAIRLSGKETQVTFISFGWETIVATQKAFPDNRCYYLKMVPFGLLGKMDEAAALGLAGVNLYYKIINEKVVKHAQDLNLEVLAWTIDEPEVILQLNKLGVNTFTSNRPKWLREQVEGLN
ncbi:glycerophosphodiester phosphodiesterase family protein [Roseimarinus sediminis]|uniref:glycerophosphodiester phosphodiesterase family protein n=1 Tax=Roseimarinus sediminis TaxID=1610899 RepID=UPI003D24AD52